MCGIIGYIGKNHPKDVLLSGLKKLEYRGYDSSGIALLNENGSQIIKSTGSINNLEKKINKTKLIESNIGIAHTRWATHGQANIINAHPHKVGKIIVVHNGIIENASELKTKLESDGIVFKSNTDTEVISALINKYYSGDMNYAIKRTIKDIKGSYALCILCEDEIDKMYAVRCESPLILGVGKNEYFVTSDISSIIDYTNKYVLLGENEIVTLDINGYTIIKDDKEIKRQVNISNLNSDNVDLQGYEHYMIKEIMEEPNLVNNLINKYVNNMDKLIDIKKYKHIHIVGCGSAYYAGLIGKYLFESDGIEVTSDVASEYRYRNILYPKKTLVILISQSGETADTIAAMRKANLSGVDTLGIVNVESSTIARECKYKIMIEAGKEIAVATTKAFILQVLVFSLLSYKIKPDKEYIEELMSIPSKLKVLLDKTGFHKMLADKVYKKKDVFFIGRKIDYASCLEGSLKLKEISYIHSEAYQAGELKHGTISLIDRNTVVFCIASDEEVYDKTISNLEEVISRGATPIYISYKNAKYRNKILVPKVHKKLQPLLIVPSLQLIAYYVAYKKGCAIDKPRNLAKSVTVE